MNRKDLSLYIKKRRAIWLRCTVFWCRTIISQEEAEDILQEVICMLYEKLGVEKLIELMSMLENPLKVVPLIHSNLTPVKFSHSPFCLFLFSSYSSCPLCRVLH